MNAKCECKMNIVGQDIVEVAKLKCLGLMLSASGSCDDEIKQRQRIGASNVVGAMRNRCWIGGI